MTTELRNYTVGVCELDAFGHLQGTHHVSSTAAASPEDASEWAINDTACDWNWPEEDMDALHVLFVMSTPIGTDIIVHEYDERAG